MATYRKVFFVKMQKLKSEIGKRKDRDMAFMYARLEGYVRGCTYYSYKSSTVIVNQTLMGRTSQQVADALGISASSVRNHTCEMSNILYGVLGDDFFDLFNNYSVNKSEINKRLYIVENGNKSSFDFMLSDFLMLINTYGIGDDYLTRGINLTECKPELTFLLRHSIPYIEEELLSLDMGKLRYLLDMLDGKQGSVEDRFNFLRVLIAKDEVVRDGKMRRDNGESDI